MTEFVFNYCLNQVMEGCAETCTQRIKKRRKRIYRNLALLKLHNFRSLNENPNFEHLKTIKTYPNDVFYSNIQMQKNTFAKLLSYVDSLWRNSFYGRPPINAELSLYITIYRLVNRATMAEISEKFSIGKGSVHRMVTRMTRILTNLKEKFIIWPQSNEEYKKLMKGFQNIKSNNPFPNVVGCLGCTHLRIYQPKIGASSYCNSNKTFSMILQAICDSNFRFINVYFGWPGGSHDADVWKKNPLYEKLQNQSIIIPQDGYILGDTNFPLETFLMVPFRDDENLSSEKIQFNETLNYIRITIEKSFGVLKKKFSILKHLPVNKLSEAKYIVSSCIMLYNFIIEMEGISASDLNNLDNDEIISPPLEQYSFNEAAIKKRNLLANSFRT
ncbi:putative nuclease HARBI1 [Condylostylus longicornis]|uniref:putative nuclease HARBI1 n=1 Tax=Condylostylus longicornis TaxID=2530218 RepID=UPI00244DF82D|nr:putative nuclease HARBI1 [Condylostylus longicornis]